jgi:hypothetical protein
MSKQEYHYYNSSVRGPNQVGRLGISELQSEDLPTYGVYGHLVRSITVSKKYNYFLKACLNVWRPAAASVYSEVQNSTLT